MRTKQQKIIYVCRSCGKKYFYLKCLKNHQIKKQHAPIWVIYHVHDDLMDLKREIQELRDEVNELKNNGLFIENFNTTLPRIRKQARVKEKNKDQTNLTIVIQEMNLYFKEKKQQKNNNNGEEHNLKPSELFRQQIVVEKTKV